jgi:preprotein translocase subunit YajC
VNSLLPLIVMFGAMILLMVWMSSRQRKAQAAQQEKVRALGVGDEVRTHSGFFGLIVEEYDDVVILETESGAQTKWARQAIAGPADPAAAQAGGAETAHEASEGAQDRVDSGSSLPDFDEGTDAAESPAARRGDIPGVTSRDDETGSAR